MYIHKRLTFEVHLRMCAGMVKKKGMKSEVI